MKMHIIGIAQANSTLSRKWNRNTWSYSYYGL